MAPAKRWAVVLTQLVIATSLVSDVRGAWEDDVVSRLESLELASESLIRQTILTQFAQEEARRSDGDSGVKQVRSTADGTRAYYSATHATHAAAAIHDHTDNIRTCGMGEIEVVLNGIHFRTRHNDYKLVEPSTTSEDYHATQEIPLPDVPPAVLNAGSVVNQIREMRSWFRAWQQQDFSERDYRPFFKPLLCYLEGAWTNNEKIDEPFESTRHHLDAKSWFDLQEKVRFTAYTGDKDQAENFAFLPTAIFNISDGVPVLGQWNYRILCHQLKDDVIELKHLRPIDDLSSRLRLNSEFTDEGFMKTRATRFQLTTTDRDTSYRAGQALLDLAMAQIPGKENYPGNIEDSALGRTKYDVTDDTKVLNAAYYHRWYKVGENDAMGVSINHRGFADRNLFVAQTNQNKVVPMEVEACKDGVCNTYNKRVSYAIPLEIVWMTPLMSWNPYNIEYKGYANTPEGRTVTADGRNGGLEADTALNGTNNINYALTPVEFFNGGEVNPNPADTVRGAIGVLDKDGNVRTVTSSGMRIFLPEIVDVPGGNLRTRFPIFPVFAEGGTTYKEVDALTKLVMDLNANAKFLHKAPTFGSSGPPTSTDSPWYTLVTSSSDATAGVHVHHVELQTEDALSMINDGEYMTVRTTLANAHSHLLNMTFDSENKQFYYVTCDGKATCWDGHPTTLFREA